MKYCICFIVGLIASFNAYTAVVSEKTVTTIADMTATTDAEVVKIVSGSGIDGTFYWDANSSETEDGGTIFESDQGGLGRWKRIYSGVINVKWFGAHSITETGYSTYNSTTSIQAAIDSANGFYKIFIPRGIFLFSSLTLPAGTVVEGESKDGSVLKRISGSTGSAIVDNGNAAKIALSKFTLHGNFTTGTGIDLGNTNIQFGTGGRLEDITVRDITNGFDIDGNVASIGYIVAQGCSGTSIKILGSANKIDELEIVSVSTSGTTGLKIASEGNIIEKLHIEGNFSKALDVSGSYNKIGYYYLTIGQSVTIPEAIYINSGCVQNQILNVTMNTSKTGSSVTNFVVDNYAGMTLPYRGPKGTYDQGLHTYDTVTLSSSHTMGTAEKVKCFVAKNLSQDISIVLPALPALYQEITLINDDSTYVLFAVAPNIAGQTSSIGILPGCNITIRASSNKWHEVGGSYYKRYAGNPVGVIQPRYIGEHLFNHSTGEWHISSGTSSTNWKKITP